MSTKRKVMVKTYSGRELEATFHQFVACVEGEIYSIHSIVCAVIEWPDGRVDSFGINDIRFLDSEVQHEQL